MTTEQEHKRLTNIAARLAACLWGFHSTCPECGNDRARHMPGCAQTYEREFHGPQDTEAVFVKAFRIMTPNVQDHRPCASTDDQQMTRPIAQGPRGSQS